jgi:alpha-L-rhamnosidase
MTRIYDHQTQQILSGSIGNDPECLLLATHGSDDANGTPASWNAQWIASPDGRTRDYDVVYFRKALSLSAVPKHFLVDVSGDTRFELHVNGKHVGAGPAKGDVHHWRYETYDLAPFLKAGTNDIAAIVWNFGTSAPIAWMSSRTAFLLSAEDPKNEAVDTGDGWKTMQEQGRTLDTTHLRGYYAAGPGEVIGRP